MKTNQMLIIARRLVHVSLGLALLVSADHSWAETKWAWVYALAGVMLTLRGIRPQAALSCSARTTTQ